MLYVDEIIQGLYAQLRTPMIVLDADMELVAHSIHQNVEHDAAQIAMIVSRRGTTGAIESLERYRVKYSTDPVRIPGKDGGRGHVVVTLRSGGTPTGYLSFPDRHKHDLPAEDLRLITKAATHLGEALYEKSVDKRRGREHVRQLVEGMLGDDPHLHEYAVREITSGRHLLPAAQYSAIIIAAHPALAESSAGIQVILQNAVGRIAGSATARCLGVVLGSEALVITPQTMDTTELAGLLAECGLDTVIAAIGGPLDSLGQIRRSRRQASIALQGVLRDPKRYGTCASWVDLGDDRILLQLPFEQISQDDLPEGLQKLFEARNASMLIEALQAYLDVGGNAVEASRRLHLHRSTLYYRLDRVTAITGLNLADGGVRRELHLALRVATFIGLRVTQSP